MGCMALSARDDLGDQLGLLVYLALEMLSLLEPEFRGSHFLKNTVHEYSIILQPIPGDRMSPVT
ncbi:hypothetical protein METHPM2_920014 [Pseudomonas sp. PM2]